MSNTNYAPDFVFVFHHPLHPYEDSTDPIGRDVELNLINDREERKAKWFSRFLAALAEDQGDG